jgi:hypothetical protein
MVPGRLPAVVAAAADQSLLLHYNGRSLQDYVYYNAQYQIAICMLCALAIWSERGVTRHCRATTHPPHNLHRCPHVNICYTEFRELVDSRNHTAYSNSRDRNSLRDFM